MRNDTLSSNHTPESGVTLQLKLDDWIEKLFRDSVA